MKTCLILDYGVGNVASIRTFLRENGYTVTLGNNPLDVRNADLLILPGVGSFNTASENMKQSGVITEIQNRHDRNEPILGICLGFQLLTNSSSESPKSFGLGIFNGSTIRLKEFSRIGWGKLDFFDSTTSFLNDYFYFNHSFGTYDTEGAYIKATSGLSEYLALVINAKTVGVQFHPERSQKSGAHFLTWLEKEIWNLDD